MVVVSFLCPNSWPVMAFRALSFGVHHCLISAVSFECHKFWQATENSRIVFVSCVGHKKGALDFANLNQDQGKWDPKHQYEMSKLAGLMFSHRLARELKGGGIFGTSVIISI